MYFCSSYHFFEWCGEFFCDKAIGDVCSDSEWNLGLSYVKKKSVDMLYWILVVALLVISALIVSLVLLWRKVEMLESQLTDSCLDWHCAADRLHEVLPRESLTRDDALLLIEEALRVGAVSEAQKEVEVSYSEPEAPGVFYFGRPTGERMFDDALKRSCPSDTTFFRFMPYRDDEDWARIDLNVTSQGKQLVLRDKMGVLEPVCELVQEQDSALGLRQLEAGVAVRRNGFWTVARKVKLGIAG